MRMYSQTTPRSRRVVRQLLRNATLIDVRGARAIEGGALLIEDDRIGAIGRADDFGEPVGAEMVADLGGMFVVPGFIDPHVHLGLSAKPDALEQVYEDMDQARRNAVALLASGVTTAADCGGPGLLTLQLKLALERGDAVGPRLLVSLNAVTTPGGHGLAFGVPAHGVEAARIVTRALLERGADFIKVMASGGGTRGATPATEAQFSLAELEAIVGEAHAAGRRVVAHTRATGAIRRAVRAGVDRLEHVTWEVVGGVQFDAALATEMARRAIWVDPTLAAGVRAESTEQVASERRGELRRQFALRYPNYRRMAQESGSRLLSGSDAGTPLVGFGDFALGPELLTRIVDYSPAEALASATWWGAQALCVEDTRGTLESGKLADLVVLRADPLQDPSALRSVQHVILGGRWQPA